MNYIDFNPKKMSREYGTNIYITKGQETSRIQYQTTILYAGLFMDEYSIFHLSKHDIFINCQELTDISYRLAQSCSEVFYPIITFCDINGKIYGIRRDILNKRWNELKPNLEKKYAGEYAKKYIDKTEKSLKDESSLLKLIRKDLFLHTFFSLKYDSNTETDLYTQLPLIAFQDSLSTKGVQNVTTLDENTIVLQKGEISDERVINYNSILTHSIKDEGNGRIDGKYHIKYTLNKEHLINSIKAFYELSKENGEFLLKIEMESYYLQEFPKQAINDAETIKLGKKILKEKAETSNKKIFRFWF